MGFNHLRILSFGRGNGKERRNRIMADKIIIYGTDT
jgi:hypothetical protein